MKQLSRILMLGLPLLASACVMSPAARPNMTNQSPTSAITTPVLPAHGMTIQDNAGTAILQKVEFRIGVSSGTVERLGKSLGCVGKTGAGLITEPGPVEVYRMQCENGTTFVARCEMRQCRSAR